MASRIESREGAIFSVSKTRLSQIYGGKILRFVTFEDLKNTLQKKLHVLCYNTDFRPSYYSVGHQRDGRGNPRLWVGCKVFRGSDYETLRKALKLKRLPL